MAALHSALLITPVLAQKAAESEQAVTVPESETTNESTGEQADAPATTRVSPLWMCAAWREAQDTSLLR